jgi:4-oxalomesaconate hydratase
MDRAIDIFRELKPSFVLTHSLEDPYNVDHPEATRFAQEARIVAQAAGHKPDPSRAYAAPPVFLFEPHQPEMCNFKPNVILNIDSVWERKKKAFEVLAAQKHLWEYYTRVALNRGMQGGRNSGKPMTYGEAYQRLSSARSSARKKKPSQPSASSAFPPCMKRWAVSAWPRITCGPCGRVRKPRARR